MNSPFDEARYRALMKGLECTEVSLSYVLLASETERFDPEYFQKQHLADAARIFSSAEQFQTFADLGLKVDASAFYPAIESYYGEGKLPFLRVGDVDSFIDFQQSLRIPAELCDLYPTLSLVAPGDIVLTKGGSVARVGW